MRHASVTMCLASAAVWLMGAYAATTEVTIGGETVQLRSYPHVPFMSVGTLEQLREHYDTVRPFLPRGPFVMEGQWVLPAPEGGFRLFPEDPERDEVFSANGEYVAVVKPYRGMGISPTSEYLTVMRTNGEVLWEMEKGPCRVWVRNDGYTIGQMTPIHLIPILEIYDLAGQCVKRIEEVFDPPGLAYDGGRIHVHESPPLLLGRSMKQVVAMEQTGEVLWRHTLPDGGPGYGISSTGLDPLGRGIYLVVGNHGDSVEKRNTSAWLVDLETGERTQTLWDQQDIHFPSRFSIGGGYAICPGTQGGVGLIDWAKGELLFFLRQIDVPYLGTADVRVVFGDASDACDDPVRLVAPLSRGLGTSVFNRDGDRIWAVSIDLEYAKNFLSPDGRVLGVARTTSGFAAPTVLLGVLLFRIDDSNMGTPQQPSGNPGR